MKDITKDKLISLGFKEEFSSPEESGTDDGYYYYIYEINEECLLISDASDENDGKFTIEFFDFNGIKVTNNFNLFELMEVIKKNIEK